MKRDRHVDQDSFTTLSRCVGDGERFASEVWNRCPAVFRGRGCFDDLLSAASIDHLLEHTARLPTFRLVAAGRTYLPREYTRTVRLGGANVDGVADPKRIAELFDGGATLVLQNLERLHAPIRAFARRLEDEISHPVQVNAYLTPAHAQGLGRHHDDHDVLILQVTGTKRWEIEGLDTVDMAAGDVVYIPKHTPHSAITSDTSSLHLTVGIMFVTLADVLRRRLGPSADRPLPLGFASPAHGRAATDVLAAALADGARALLDADPAEVLAAERRRLVTRRDQPPSLADRIAIDRIDDSTRVHRRPGLALDVGVVGNDVDPSAGSVEIRLTDRTITLPAAAATTVRRLLAGPSVRLAELTDLDPRSRLTVARRLLRESVLAIERDTAHGPDGPDGPGRSAGV